jgi:oxygen-independent coproporphyrinogen III oxidase
MQARLSAARDEVQAYVDAHIGQRQVNRVLHGFPSPRFWQPDAVSVPRLMQQRERSMREHSRRFSLYVGLPYCVRTEPDRCGYCLFPVETFAGATQLDTYLDYLEKEGDLFRDFFAGTTPETVYIGGGTPNLLRPNQYTRLMEIIRGVFPGVATGVPVTLEGIPQLFTREKLEHMQRGGINRISIGVQQLDPELNKLSGRKQTSKHVFDAIRWAQELGLQCNVDLIFGWPRQTLRTMLSDLEQIIAANVEHIAHYELNIGGPTDFSLNRRHELPSPELTRDMYRTARDFLLANGYRQLTVYDFQKSTNGSGFVYEECKRDFDEAEMWGWGFAGVSEFCTDGNATASTYVNHRRVRDYFAALDRTEFPSERGFVRTAVDQRLHGLFRNLQGGSVNRSTYASRFGSDPYEEFEPVWQVIAERGWCSVSPESIELVDDGVYYVPLVQHLLSLNRLEELRASASAVALRV